MAGEREQGVADAVNALRESYEQNSKDVRAIGEVMDRRFGRQRLWMIVIAAVVLLAVLGSVGFRQADTEREKDRQAVERQREVDQRENLIAGCERGNEARATHRAVIIEAYEPSTIPSGISPELERLYREGLERQATKRAYLLSLPGVQPVDCQAAYPPPDEE